MGTILSGPKVAGIEGFHYICVYSGWICGSYMRTFICGCVYFIPRPQNVWCIIKVCTSVSGPMFVIICIHMYVHTYIREFIVSRVHYRGF